MLTYHPGLDPHHSALRVLRLLAWRNDMELDRVRLLDFFLLFPELLVTTMRLPHSMKSRAREFPQTPERYRAIRDPAVAFRRVWPSHQQGLRLLAASGLVRSNEEIVTRTELAFSVELGAVVATRDEGKRALLNFLTHDLAEFPLSGVGGLKDRSNLMDSRYDPT